MITTGRPSWSTLRKALATFLPDISGRRFTTIGVSTTAPDAPRSRSISTW